MPVYITAYLGTLISFCVLDFLWLGIIAKGFYQTRFGTLMLEQPKLIPAAAFYLLYVVGLLIFAVLPALRAQSTLTAVGFGAFLGLIAYGCYDLTNLSTLKGWSLSLSLVDIAWGIFISGAASIIGFWTANFFSKS